ncbi:uncharacterized protein MYCFIDRAFT_172328 [Pseudocercospora fijiensis CIRAD86]|uniref:Uncharacterized protein n=1 Tax=Pseudocercospora fijiensis (strain CIRAD86) TaxID=383855 RepID=M2Z9T9_PSEFD|nr:uncharacterized protein MYCFIDRAFT_172328 [Pseudocercospora fijiensis CIRAD86]EME86610.1 hypothetical protein MYCFIDRAFT_172328 [Pseudocercospora fijiensis CIRAD86]
MPVFALYVATMSPRTYPYQTLKRRNADVTDTAAVAINRDQSLAKRSSTGKMSQ